MRYFSTCLAILLFCLDAYHSQAQDSLSYFEKETAKMAVKRTVLEDYYNNPANKVDYSSFSYSDFFVDWQQEQKNVYEKQEGNKNKGMGIHTHSFQKLDSTTSIWGKASYVNQEQSGVSWNSGLDFDKIRPYVMADSTIATNKFQSYAFEGGYAKELKKWQLGALLNYQANMGYRTRDPRPKSISSDINLKLGLGYALHKNWTADTYALLSKYTQNTSVKFANEVQQASLYQMQGLGTWNSYFSNKATEIAFEELGYQIGLNIAKNQTKDFVIGASLGRYNLNKLIFSSVGTNDGGDDLNTLKKEQAKIYALKTFQWKQHQWGLKWQTELNKHTGTDILYSNNDKYLIRLMEKENYRWEDNSHTLEGFYSFTAPTYSLSVTPYFEYQRTTELLKATAIAQKFHYQYLGLRANYYQKIDYKSAFRFSPTLRYRNVFKSTNDLQIETRKESIREWLNHDFKYNSTNYIHWGAAASYQFQPSNFPVVYLTLDWSSIQFTTKETNQDINLSLGIIF